MSAQFVGSTFLILPLQTGPAAPKEPARNHVDEDDDPLSRANREIARLKVALADKELRLLNFGIVQGKVKKGLQQKVRRADVKLVRKPLPNKSTHSFTDDDVKLLRCIKAAESKLKKEHSEHFVHVLRRLAQAILDDKLPINSIELEYICQLTVNLSQNYTNKFTFTDNIMRFCSALVKLRSGIAVLELLRAGSPDNASTSAQLVKETHVNWHFPSLNSILAWDKKNDVDPDFILGVSEATIQHMQDTTQGIVRLGTDATDCHGTPGFLPGGTFEQGDVFFPGSGYDAAKLEDAYGELARPVEKYAANPSSIENQSTAEQDEFVANCTRIRDFLQERIAGMSSNLSALRDQLSKHREEYQRRQTVRAQKKEASKESSSAKPAGGAKGKGSALKEDTLDRECEVEEELNAAQKRVMDKTRAQVDAAQHGIHVVQTFLKECAEPQAVPYLLASTVLNALQEYYRSQREMACKIF
jgi:hypothetical protein